MPAKRKAQTRRVASAKRQQCLKVPLSELLKVPSAAITKKILANYEGACQLMAFSVDDEDADQADPVYTIVFNESGLQARINAGTAVDQDGALLPNVDAARDHVINYIRANGGADFHLVGVNFHFQSCNALSNCEAGIAAGMGWTAPVPGQPNIAAAAMTLKVADRGTAGPAIAALRESQWRQLVMGKRASEFEWAVGKTAS
ncbi:g3632 [Coccomyxa elongata]